MRQYHKMYEQVRSGAEQNPAESYDYSPDKWHEVKGMRYKMLSPSESGGEYTWEIYGTWGDLIGTGSFESRKEATKKLSEKIKSLRMHYEAESMREKGHPWEPGSVKDEEPVYPGETISVAVPKDVGYEDELFLALSREWDGYYVKAYTKGGEYETRTYGPFKSRDKAEERGTSAAATMVGLLLVEDEDIDSDGMSELYENASRLANHNPSNPPGNEDPLEYAASSFSSEALIGTPGDPHEAFRQGMFRGVLIGIDQCGISPGSWWKRRKLRKAAKEASEEAIRKHAEAIFRGGASTPAPRPKITR